MKQVMGVINLGYEKEFLKEVTNHRCLSSVPFGGRYRLIDFALSNMVNAGIFNVAVFTRRKYRALLDHLGSGKEWDLDRQRDGLFILPPTDTAGEYKGDIQHFNENLAYFKRSTADYVIVTTGNLVWNIDYNEVFAHHIRTSADITMIYKGYDGDTIDEPIYHTIEMNSNGRVEGIVLETFPVHGDNVFLDTYVIKKSLLVELISSGGDNDRYDSLNDSIKDHLEKLNVQSFRFEGYMPFIHSIQSYFNHNMDLLDPMIAQQLFFNKRYIYTKVKHGPPAKYLEASNVTQSLVANGCVIEGTVENSILFRDVIVRKGATVRNSIIMQKGEIGEGAIVENAIFDKDVKISKDCIVIGEIGPIVVSKSTVL